MSPATPALAQLTLARDGERLILTVRDYGRGLGADAAPATGMRGMQERAALIGASLKVHDLAPDPGCEVRLEVPLEEPL